MCVELSLVNTTPIRYHSKNRLLCGAIHSLQKGLDGRGLTLKSRAVTSGSDVCLDYQDGERKVAGRVGRA